MGNLKNCFMKLMNNENAYSELYLMKSMIKIHLMPNHQVRPKLQLVKPLCVSNKSWKQIPVFINIELSIKNSSFHVVFTRKQFPHHHPKPSKHVFYKRSMKFTLVITKSKIHNLSKLITTMDHRSNVNFKIIK